MSEAEELERAITALESQRAILGDAVVDASQAALREKLAALETNKRPDRQRRQVTVLFMDVAGSTSIIRELDPEDNLSIVDGALQQLTKPIMDHGGRVVRFMGDGFMALFGHPVASEKDPDMAVRAGLALLALARDYAVELQARWAITGFNVRVGISTGLVAIGAGSEGKDTLAGAAVNLAARLESAATPGTVLISSDTYRHIRGAFDLESQEAISAKGFADPVTVYRVLRERPRSFHTRRRGVEGIETQMIGREQELNQLQEFFTTVLEEGRQRIVTVAGDAGIGKSRLLYEFESWVDLLPVTVHRYWGRARLETHGLPYSLLRDIFATCFGLQDDDAIQVVRKKILRGFTELLGDSSETQMKAHWVGDLLGYSHEEKHQGSKNQEDPRQMRDRALAYVIDYFMAAAAIAPVLLMLEDLHWADDSSLDILAGLAPALRDTGVFLVETTRPALFERRPNWGEGFSNYNHLDMSPLSPADTENLIENILQKVPNIPAELKRLVVGNTDGNPFFVEELVKMLVEDGIIVKGDDLWQVQQEGLVEIQVPSTLTGVLQARLASLSKEERLVIEQASVVGRVFWDETVNYINNTGKARLMVEAVPPVMKALLGREMIYRRESSTFGESEEYIFKNAVMRQVTYESVPIQARQTYHSLVADWMIERSGDRQDEFSGQIAGHLERAGRPEEAIAYLERAGESAAAKYANEEAIEYYSEALSLIPEEMSPTGYGLLLAREELFGRLGRRKEQRKDLQALTALAEASGQLVDQLEGALRWVSFYDATGDYLNGVEMVTGVVKQAEQVGDLSLAARGSHLWGRLLLNQGRYEEARSHLTQAIHGFRQIGDPLYLGLTLNQLGGTAFNRGDFPAAREYYEQALKIFHEIGNRESEAFALNNLGNIAAEHGDYATAWERYEAALAIHREVRRRFGEELILGNLGNAAIWQGKLVEGQSYYQQGLAIANEIGDEEGKGWMLQGLGDTKLFMGEPQEAVAYFRKALAIRDELGQQYLAFVSRAGLARSFLALGENSAARSQLEPILIFLSGGGELDTHISSEIYLACIQTLMAVGDPQAADLLQAAYSHLQGRASKITDPETRKSFLENIPLHRELGRLWEAAKTEKE